MFKLYVRPNPKKDVHNKPNPTHYQRLCRIAKELHLLTIYPLISYKRLSCFSHQIHLNILLMHVVFYSCNKLQQTSLNNIHFVRGIIEHLIDPAF